MEQLPDRGWDAIIARANMLGIERPYSVGYGAGNSTNAVPFVRLSVNDWRFIQEHAIDAEEVLQKRVYWREYVELPTEANRVEPLPQHNSQR